MWKDSLGKLELAMPILHVTVTTGACNSTALETRTNMKGKCGRTLGRPAKGRTAADGGGEGHCSSHSLLVGALAKERSEVIVEAAHH